MSTAVATQDVRVHSLIAVSEEEILSTMESSVYPGAKRESIKLALAWCRAQNKDPLKKPVHLVPMRVKTPKAGGKKGFDYTWRDVIMQGIGDYRTDASRTGEYAGMDEAVFGPIIKRRLGGEPKKEWSESANGYVESGKFEEIDFEFPEWCSLTVYRLVQGTRCPFSSGKVYFTETYATSSNETSLPNAMWKKRPRGQLEKCAEAMALRRGFPEVGSTPTTEEMEGRIIEAPTERDITPTPGVRMPEATDATDQTKGSAAAEPTADQQPGATIDGATGAVEQPKAADNKSSPDRACSAGEIAHIKKRMGQMLEPAMADLKITSMESLTLSQFQALKAWAPK